MTWIKRELKKRERASQPAAAKQSTHNSEPARLQEIWDKFKSSNVTLPSEIQLQLEAGSPSPPFGEDVIYLEWLRAPNGAALGYTGHAIRYLWPKRSQKRSNNFWIHWNIQLKRYVLIQRINALAPPAVVEYRFDENRVEYMTKCLVLGRRVASRSVRKKLFWLF